MRPEALAKFVSEASIALGRTRGPAAAVAETVVTRMQAPAGAVVETPETLPVCDWIAPALARFDTPLARAFAPLAGQLAWRRRSSARPEDGAFWSGHANAMIFGPGALEDRPDLWVGATVMAPGTLYPDHSHPPAEVYLPLSPGEWWNSEMDWTDPGPEGFIYNPPGITHAMRAGNTPFLALWFLPL